MRIIGSSRIDDYKKLSVEDNVLRAIGAKPGDSVLFYRNYNDDRVCIYKTEGAKITTEADAPRRRHMREAFIRVRIFLGLAAVFTILRLIMTVFNYELLGPLRFAEAFTLSILTLAFVGASIFVSQIVDKPYDPQALVTIGNIYAKNRLTGLSKMTTDGFVASANLYVNSLFGANPESVDLVVKPQHGDQFYGVVSEIKSVPGYSVYRLHIKEQVPESGTLTVTIVYKYLGKKITVNSHFEMLFSEKDKDISLVEGPVDAAIEFDHNFNDTEFDESWFNAQNDIL